RDKKTRLNFIYIALNIYKVTNCKENMYKTFKNENVELMSFTISHLRNSKFVDKVQDLRNEYTGFLYSRFDMLKQSDIDNTKEKITVIDKVLKDTYSIYNLVPEELLKEKVSVFEIENYLKNDINEYFDGEVFKHDENNWIALGLSVFIEFDEYKENIKKIDMKL